MLARVLNAPLHFNFQKIWSKRFSISKDIFATKEVVYNQRFFHDQEGFPQAKIFPWSRKFSTSKDFSTIKEVFHKQRFFLFLIKDVFPKKKFFLNKRSFPQGVIHKVHTLKERRGGQAKSAPSRMRGGWKVQLEACVRHNFLFCMLVTKWK